MFRSRTIPLLVTVFLHGMLLIFLLVKFTDDIKDVKSIKPEYINASLLTLNDTKRKAAKKAPEAAPKPPPEPEEQKPEPEPEKAEPEKVEPPEPEKKAEPEKPPEPKEDVQAQQMIKKKADDKKKAEQKKKADAKKKAEAKKKTDAKKKADEKKKADKLRKDQAKEMAKALAEEEAELESAEDNEEVGNAYGFITSVIERNWSRPPSARLGMRAVVKIFLVPSGEVSDVVIIESSGHAEFDRSVINAVRKAESFPELQQFTRAEFEKNFREFEIIFNPEDLRR